MKDHADSVPGDGPSVQILFVLEQLARNHPDVRQSLPGIGNTSGRPAHLHVDSDTGMERFETLADFGDQRSHRAGSGHHHLAAERLGSALRTNDHAQEQNRQGRDE